MSADLEASNHLQPLPFDAIRAIAVTSDAVGALRRGDQQAALFLLDQAVELDPLNAAAQRGLDLLLPAEPAPLSIAATPLFIARAAPAPAPFPDHAAAAPLLAAAGTAAELLMGPPSQAIDCQARNRNPSWTVALLLTMLLLYGGAAIRSRALAKHGAVIVQQQADPAATARPRNTGKRAAKPAAPAAPADLVQSTLAGQTASMPRSAPGPTPIAGWTKFEAGGAVIWLPESYWGGDPTNRRDMVVEKLRSQAPSAEDAARILRSSQSNLVLIAVDSQIGLCGCSSSITVLRLKVPLDATLDALADLTVKNLPPRAQWRSRI